MSTRRRQIEKAESAVNVEARELSRMLLRHYQIMPMKMLGAIEALIRDGTVETGKNLKRITKRHFRNPNRTPAKIVQALKRTDDAVAELRRVNRRIKAAVA